ALAPLRPPIADHDLGRRVGQAVQALGLVNRVDSPMRTGLAPPPLALHNPRPIPRSKRRGRGMNGAAAVAEVLKREGGEFLIAYLVHPIIQTAAEADIRTIIVRQERTGLHMADAVSRVTSGRTIGVFAMQHGPGTENAFGGVAQAFADSAPI